MQQLPLKQIMATRSCPLHDGSIWRGHTSCSCRLTPPTSVESAFMVPFMTSRLMIAEIQGPEKAMPFLLNNLESFT